MSKDPFKGDNGEASYNLKLTLGHKPDRKRSSFQSLDGSDNRRACFWTCLSLIYLYFSDRINSGIGPLYLHTGFARNCLYLGQGFLKR